MDWVTILPTYYDPYVQRFLLLNLSSYWDPAVVKDGHGDLEALPELPYQAVRGQTDVLKPEVRSSSWSCCWSPQR